MAVPISSFRPQKQASGMHLSNIHREAVHNGSRCIIRTASSSEGRPLPVLKGYWHSGCAHAHDADAMEKKPRKAIRACVAIAFPFL